MELSKVSSLPADEILYSEGCAVSPSSSSSSLMMATAAA